MTPVDLSYTRLRTFERCPWAYHLVYDLGWRSGPTAPMALGQSLHKTLEAFFRLPAPERTREMLGELFDHFWVNEGFRTPQETFEAYEAGRRMLDRFCDAENPQAVRVADVEHEFAVEMAPGVIFRGTVDRIDHTDGGLSIVEYKTAATEWPAERVQSDLQMTFYALGVSMENPGTSLALRYVFLSAGRSVETHRDAATLERARELVIDTARRIAGSDRAPRHASCPSCEFRSRCDKAAPAAVARS